jgi:hypothetical protein
MTVHAVSGNSAREPDGELLSFGMVKIVLATDETRIKPSPASLRSAGTTG